MDLSVGRKSVDFKWVFKRKLNDEVEIRQDWLARILPKVRGGL